MTCFLSTHTQCLTEVLERRSECLSRKTIFEIFPKHRDLNSSTASISEERGYVVCEERAKCVRGDHVISLHEPRVHIYLRE